MIDLHEYKLKLEALMPELKKLRAALGIEATEKRIAELDGLMNAQDFWDSPDESKKVLVESKRLKDKLESFRSLEREHDDVYTLIELALEAEDESLDGEIVSGTEKLESDVENMRLATLLSGEFDSANAIMSFQAGAGGTEAQDWTQMLYRMYTHWAERHGFTYKLLDYIEGDEAGLKSASILIEGTNSYGFLRSEGGVHRLVRVSPFDASGRRHTSFAAVEVMPEISDEIEVEIREEDLKVDTYRSGGAGGQHVNKTESAIRITHIPSGVVVACQNERSQHQNREVAMRMLRSKLVEIKEREHLEKIEDIKGEQKLIEWGSQIRSYVFMPYTLVKDHRTNFEIGNVNAVMDGDLDGFINAYLTKQALGE